MDERLYIQEIRQGVYLIDEDHGSTGYLVISNDRACVIDTMNGLTDLGSAVRELTDKPLTVVNTHAHPDHIGGNVYFERAYLHPADRELAKYFTEAPEFADKFREQGLVFPPFEDINHGDVIDLGGRTLEVYHTPGHTPGGIMLLLKEETILFTGDSVNHHLWMQVDGALPLREYIGVLDSLMFLEDRADIILHGHAHDTDDISLMRCLRNGIAEICAGDTQNDLPYHWFGGVDMQHSFACCPDKQYQQADHVICYRRSFA